MTLKELLERYDAFIFDFDGVIVDSLGIKAEAFGQLFVELGPKVMAEVKAYHLSHGGVSRYEKFKHYYRTYKGREITSIESADLDRQYSELVVRKVVAASALPGVEGVLRAIKDSGKFCCVVSATPEAEIRHIVKERGMEMFFAEVLGSPRSKLDSVGIILQKHTCVPARTLYFGDAKSDLQAAEHHGVSFIGVVPVDGGELSSAPGIERIRDFTVFLGRGERS